MADEIAKKRAKTEKAEQFELVKKLVHVRGVASKLYEEQLNKRCKDRLRSMCDGTAAGIKLPPIYDATKTAELVVKNEAILKDIHTATHEFQEMCRYNDNLDEKLERKAEKLRILRKIQQRINTSQGSDASSDLEY